MEEKTETQETKQEQAPETTAGASAAKVMEVAQTGSPMQSMLASSLCAQAIPRPQAVSLGRVLLYTLNEFDALRINEQREARDAFVRQTGVPPHAGAQTHQGNQVKAGEEYPVIVTRVWGPECFNGQVLLDGNDTLWVTSASVGFNVRWPPRS